MKVNWTENKIRLVLLIIFVLFIVVISKVGSDTNRYQTKDNGVQINSVEIIEELPYEKEKRLQEKYGDYKTLAPFTLKTDYNNFDKIETGRSWHKHNQKFSRGIEWTIYTEDGTRYDKTIDNIPISEFTELDRYIEKIKTTTDETITISIHGTEKEVVKLLYIRYCLYSDITSRTGIYDVVDFEKRRIDLSPNRLGKGGGYVEFDYITLKIRVDRMRAAIEESEHNEEKLKHLSGLWLNGLNTSADGEELLQELYNSIWKVASIIEIMGDGKTEELYMTLESNGVEFLSRNCTNPTSYLNNGSGHCVAKSELIQWLMDYNNIQCICIDGFDWTGGAHQWNAIGIGNQWFQFDTLNIHIPDYYATESDMVTVNTIVDIWNIPFKYHKIMFPSIQTSYSGYLGLN